MTDSRAMAYVNMYGILGTIENLCEIDSVAMETISKLKKPVSICFNVKGGPCCTFSFTNDNCKMHDGSEGCNCKMNFASPEKFNDFINNSKPGIPTKGIPTVLSFLMGPFTALTNRLTELLRPDEKALDDRAFFEESTLLTLYTIAGSISALANNDPVSKQSALYTVDGEALMGIKDSVAVTISVKNHIFKTVKSPCDNPRAIMQFADIDLANGLFNGKVSTINEMCKGRIKIAGMISMIDNINRILDRVSVYLS